MTTNARPSSTPSHDHRFQCVGLVPIFAALTEEERHRVAAVARTRRYERQEMIFVPGDRPGLHIVHRGRVKTFRITESGGEQLVRIVGAGDFVGETSMLTALDGSDYAVAVEPSEVCSISRSDIHDLLVSNPDVALALLAAVAGRLHTAEERLSSLSGLSVGERLAQHLLEQATAAGSLAFRLRSTKKDLAGFLGTTPETLSRRLAAMQDRHLIRLGRARAVEILDPDGLAGFRG